MKRRNTPVKQAILGMLEQAATALSQDMIEKGLEIAADKVTIYRVLNSFCEDGIVHRAVSEEGKSYYALCKGCNEEKHVHHHFHFKCIGCEKVECLQEPVAVQLPKGYTFASMNCWVSGYCKTCAATAGKKAGADSRAVPQNKK